MLLTKLFDVHQSKITFRGNCGKKIDKRKIEKLSSLEAFESCLLFTMFARVGSRNKMNWVYFLMYWRNWLNRYLCHKTRVALKVFHFHKEKIELVNLKLNEEDVINNNFLCDPFWGKRTFLIEENKREMELNEFNFSLSSFTAFHKTRRLNWF